MDSSPQLRRTLLLSGVCLFLSSGCVQKNYRYGIANQVLASKLPRTPNLITVGGDHPRIDSLERTLQYPGKVFRTWFPPNAPQENPDSLRLAAIQTATDYLDDNELKGVYVDVREYNPHEQWNRLKSNTRIAPFWKYTGGTLYHIGYCVLPGRAIGFDSYNGFTNTLSINSTSSASSIMHAGYVKKIYDQRYPGTYIAANWLPIMPLFRDSSVSSDVLTYARLKGNWPLEKELLPRTYAKLGGDTVAQATSLIPGVAYLPFYFTPALTAAGNIAGEATGNLVAKQRERKLTEQAYR
jgi:hypothetical protein